MATIDLDSNLDRDLALDSLGRAELLLPLDRTFKVRLTMHGTRSMLRGGQWFPRRRAISLHIGVPKHAEGHDFEAALRLRDAVRKEMLFQCHEPDLSGETVSL